MADRIVIFRESNGALQGVSSSADNIICNGVQFGADITVSRGIADRLDLASGDTLNIVNGNLQFGGVTAIEAGGHATFTSDATDPGVNVGSVAGDPSALANGDIWYNSTTNKFRGRENGSSVDLVSAGTASGWTDGGAEVYLTTSTDEVTVGTTGGTLGKFTVRGDGSSQITIAGRAAGAQTADLLSLQDSSGNDMLATSVIGGLSTTYISNSVTVNRVLYKNATTDRVAYANATSISTSGTVVGVARATVSAGNPVGVTYAGLVTLDAAAGITVTTGDTVYLAATSGEVSNVPPSTAGNVILRLGYAKTTSPAGGTFIAQWMPGEPIVVG